MISVVISCVEKFHSGEYAMLPLSEGQSLLFLFTPYTPFDYPEETALVDAYYIESNSSYQMSKRLIESLNLAGVEASLYKGNDVKILAQKCGGAFGKNNLLFLDAYGSFFFITAILLKGEFQKFLQPLVMPCDSCGLCVAACPSDALSGGYCREKCIRHWHDRPSEMPDGIRAVNGLRLLGCNTCQTVCPVNAQKRADLPMQLQKLLEIDTLEKHSGEKTYMEQLSHFIGSNYAVKKRICGMAEIVIKGKSL